MSYLYSNAVKNSSDRKEMTENTPDWNELVERGEEFLLTEDMNNKNKNKNVSLTPTFNDGEVNNNKKINRFNNDTFSQALNEWVEYIYHDNNNNNNNNNNNSSKETPKNEIQKITHNLLTNIYYYIKTSIEKAVVKDTGNHDNINDIQLHFHNPYNNHITLTGNKNKYGLILGIKGNQLRMIRQAYPKVNITIPPLLDPSNQIVFKGGSALMVALDVIKILRGIPNH